MKAPADQFYYSDWIKDTRGLTLEEKGAWIDTLAFCWFAPERGELNTTYDELARQLGCEKDVAERIVTQLARRKICDVVTKPNNEITIISRRQRREHKERLNGKLRQRKFRENHGSNGGGNGEVTRVSTSTTASTDKKRVVTARSQKVPYGLTLEDLKRALPDWPTSVIEYYHGRAQDYSKSNEATYVDWIAAIRNWNRADKAEHRGPYKQIQRNQHVDRSVGEWKPDRPPDGSVLEGIGTILPRLLPPKPEDGKMTPN